MAENEFFSFEEALDELRLQEEELKRLVSEGEIRAFRDGETMRLRRTDVETLRGELSGGEVVDLGDASEELVFEDDLDEAGMATEEISEMDTLLDEEIEDVGTVEDTVPMIEEEEELIEEAPVAATRTRSAAADAEAGAPDEGGFMRAVLVVTALVLLLGVPVALSVGLGSAGSMAKAVAGLFGGEIAE